MSLKTDLRPVAVNLYKIVLLHHMYPDRYAKLAAGTSVKKGKAVFLEERESELADNFLAVYHAMEGLPYERVPVFIHDQDGKNAQDPVSLARRNRKVLEELADAEYIFLNDSSSLVSCLPVRKETKVIQLWHACGAFKKFGYSLSGKKYGMERAQLDRFPMHRNFTYVTVSSPEVVWAYEEAFDMKQGPGKVVPAGIARTDQFFDPARAAEARRRLEKVLSPVMNPQQLAEKKIVLYAPTFRGNSTTAVSPDFLDYTQLHKLLGDKYLFLVKHHPFVRFPKKIDRKLASFAVDVTKQMTIEDLLMVSDVCISDYSSLIFEFALLERPMIFLAPDLEDYGDWRGFYYPYEEMTPGPVLKDTGETAACLKKLETPGGWKDKEKVRSFREKFMSACDGKACEKILELP